MKIAVMQPYFFPYLGYFQLVNSVDLFVFLDDVTFIKQGWINRNRVLVGGSPLYFTVPLKAVSSNVAINKTRIPAERYPRWRRKFMRTLEQHYGKSARFHEAFALVESTLSRSYDEIASLAIESVEQCARYLGVSTGFSISSRDFPNNQGLTGAERIQEICRETGAGTYVNPVGGVRLYQREDFAEHGIDLVFLSPRRRSDLPHERAIAELSILHALMHTTPKQSRSLLADFELR